MFYIAESVEKLSEIACDVPLQVLVHFSSQRKFRASVKRESEIA